MNRKNKIICFILVSFFFLSGIFTQTNFLAPTIPISNSFSTHSEEDALKTPKTSDVSGHYDYGDGNTMDIDAIDNTTTTTFTNTTSGEHLTIESEKNDSSVSTTFNENLTISSDLENIVQLEWVNNSNSLHMFDLLLTDKNQLALESSNLEGDAIKFYSNVTLDDENNSLDSFYGHAEYFPVGLPRSGFFNITYLKDDPDGYDLNIYPEALYDPVNLLYVWQDTNINYDEEANEYKWNDKTHKNLLYVGNRFTSDYTINNSGVWEDSTQVIDWTTPDLQTYNYKDVVFWGDVYQINITKFYDTIVIHYSTFVAPGRFGLETYLYQLVFTRTNTGIIVMDYELSGAPMRLVWRDHRITLYLPIAYRPEYLVITYHLQYVSELLYEIAMATFFRAMFFRQWNEFVFGGIRISMVVNQNYFDIEIGSRWYLWMYQMAYSFLNLFIGYEIQIRYLIWLYIFYVPTLILPNLLTINILQIIYNRKSLDIIIKVTEQFGFNIAGATITGTWDGASIGTISDNGDGTYSFSLPAKGKFVRNLNLIASKTGYANGILNVEITVKSPGGGSKTSKGGNGLSVKDFLGLYLLAIVSTIATVFIGKYLGVPKTLGIAKYFDKKKYQRNKL